MKPDLELEAWREQWRAQSEVPPDLLRGVRRGTRNMRLMVAAEVLVTVAIGGGAALWAVREPRTAMIVLALATWLFLAAAWTFAVINRRGIWSPSAATTAQYVELSIRRYRRKLSAMRFGVGLYFTEAAFCLVWLYRESSRRLPWSGLIYGIVTPVFLLGLAGYRRKIRAELSALEELRSASSDGLRS